MQDHLTVSGWIFIILAWASILGLNAYCFYQVFRKQADESHEKEPFVTL